MPGFVRKTQDDLINEGLEWAGRHWKNGCQDPQYRITKDQMLSDFLTRFGTMVKPGVDDAIFEAVARRLCSHEIDLGPYEESFIDDVLASFWTMDPMIVIDFPLRKVFFENPLDAARFAKLLLADGHSYGLLNSID